MRDIIGLITAWGAEEWIEPAINQAIEFCDEVIVCVSYHHKNFKKLGDSTYNIADKYRNEVTIIDYDLDYDQTFWENRASCLNEMLNYSKLYKKGNWVWLLDADEFYYKRAIKGIKELIKRDIADEFIFDEMFFYIDMVHYLQASHRNRLVKIKTDYDYFKPTNVWTPKPKSAIKLSPIRFHYSLLSNPKLHKITWELEGNLLKVLWLDKIYLHFDLSNQDYWIEENRKLTGIKSPFYNTNYKPKTDGHLFEWNGDHPTFVQYKDKTRDRRKR